MTMDEIVEQRGRPMAVVGTQTNFRMPRATRGTQTDFRRPTAPEDTQTDFSLGDRMSNDDLGALGWTVTVDTETNKRLCRCAVDQNDGLIPGIPDDITLHGIAPKLPWTAFDTLSSVSRGWEQAIQSHRVHDARVRSHTAETFIVIQCYRSGEIALFSLRDKYYHRLPGLPRKEGNSLELHNWISVDGKLFGWREADIFHRVGVDEGVDEGCCCGGGCRSLYALDLAGRRMWKQCASMEEGRSDSGFGTVGGKIYVFGGLHKGKPVVKSEVYDPKENTWSQVSSEMHWRRYHHVATLGEQLVLHGGMYDPDYKSGEGTALPNLCADFYASFWEMYHPGKDVRKMVQPFEENRDDHWRTAFVFVAQGKLHRMTKVGNPVDDIDGFPVYDIDVYDCDRNNWSHLHSLSLVDVVSSARMDCCLWNVMAIDDEILVLLLHMTEKSELCELLLLSEGFGSSNKEITWEAQNEYLPVEAFSVLCTAQL